MGKRISFNTGALPTITKITLLVIILLIACCEKVRCQKTGEFDIIEVEIDHFKDGDSGYMNAIVPDYANRKNSFYRLFVEFRLFRVDTHEMGSKNAGKKQVAQKGKAHSEEVALDRPLKAKYWGKDVHGRWLISLYLEQDHTLKESLDEEKLTTRKYRRARKPRRPKFY